MYLELTVNETALQQKANFGRGAAIGWLITVMCAELAVGALPPLPSLQKVS